MTVEIICVGTEILMGNIINTNAAFLAEQCAAHGCANYYQTVVGDNAERLEWAIRTAMERADVVLLSGGLGPTEDDMTKEVAAKVCGRKLVEDAASRKAIEDFFHARGKEPTENNWKQALVPEGGHVIPNPNGTAPGICIEDDRCALILMPGPPEEMKPMFFEYVVPQLVAMSDQVFYSKMVKVCGVGESRAETEILDLIDGQTNPTIATYAKLGEVDIRVTASGATREEARATAMPVVEELKKRFGDHVFTLDEEVNLEQALVNLLLDRNLTVATAESCTGGLIASRLVNVPGVSEVFGTGLVTYANEAKQSLLGVKKQTLQKFGAVSEETALEMAKGLAAGSRADVVIATTGIAGPDGGTEEKPVGTVYIGVGVRGEYVVKRYNFRGNRGIIRQAASTAALDLARMQVLSMKEKKTGAFHGLL
jgi:nicotinamide-nucleotide amidase